MNSRLSAIINFIGHYKYLIVCVLGVLVVGFLDENSFMHRIRYELEISDLKKQIKAYKERNEANVKQLKELRRNPKTIEKIARERYFMKADDEDIFVLSDDNINQEEQDETTK